MPDAPLIQFEKDKYEVDESLQSVTAKVTRTGNLENPSTVQCYTMDGTAQSGLDFIARLDGESTVSFSSGITLIHFLTK